MFHILDYQLGGIRKDLTAYGELFDTLPSLGDAALNNPLTDLCYRSILKDLKLDRNPSNMGKIIRAVHQHYKKTQLSVADSSTKRVVLFFGQPYGPHKVMKLTHCTHPHGLRNLWVTDEAGVSSKYNNTLLNYGSIADDLAVVPVAAISSLPSGSWFLLSDFEDTVHIHLV